ncbi:MAG: hypothetical protein HY609_04565 [Deltaproteobacteria bacterium]|nr:hypothetical protein [Deltaproteobacteria bacterium]MBI4224183.1 hypothetical protein [Deltaproteobacteria bacterium]
MRKFLTVLLMLISFSLFGGDAEEVLLQFRPTPRPLSYLAAFHLQETDLMNIAMETGESKILQREKKHYMEIRKDLTRRGSQTDIPFTETAVQASLLDNTAKIHILKNESGEGRTAKPRTMVTSQFINGRLVQPFDLADLSAAGLPLLFSDQKVKQGSLWERPIDFKRENLPPLAFNTKYEVVAFQHLAGHPVAVVTYTFKAALQSTLISQDPLIQQKVAELKRENVESVAYKGEGRFTFDYREGLLLTHSLTMSEKISKSYIEGRQRKLQDIVRIYEYSEALIP